MAFFAFCILMWLLNNFCNVYRKRKPFFSRWCKMQPLSLDTRTIFWGNMSTNLDLTLKHWCRPNLWVNSSYCSDLSFFPSFSIWHLFQNEWMDLSFFDLAILNELMVALILKLARLHSYRTTLNERQHLSDMMKLWG